MCFYKPSTNLDLPRLLLASSALKLSSDIVGKGFPYPPTPRWEPSLRPQGAAGCCSVRPLQNEAFSWGLHRQLPVTLHWDILPPSA